LGWSRPRMRSRSVGWRRAPAPLLGGMPDRHVERIVTQRPPPKETATGPSAPTAAATSSSGWLAATAAVGITASPYPARHRGPRRRASDRGRAAGIPRGTHRDADADGLLPQHRPGWFQSLPGARQGRGRPRQRPRHVPRGDGGLSPRRRQRRRDPGHLPDVCNIVQETVDRATRPTPRRACSSAASPQSPRPGPH
jgi:hypothetical protein